MKLFGKIRKWRRRKYKVLELNNNFGSGVIDTKIKSNMNINSKKLYMQLFDRLACAKENSGECEWIEWNKECSEIYSCLLLMYRDDKEKLYISQLHVRPVSIDVLIDKKIEAKQCTEN